MSNYIKTFYRDAASPTNILVLLGGVWAAAIARISSIFSMRDKSAMPENILAFRTISTMLSYLPRAVPIAAFDNFKSISTSPTDAQVLQLTDAFTQLAHIGNGKHVIAASANSSISHLKAEIQVVASPEPPAPLDTQPSPSGLVPKALCHFQTFLVMVRNDRRGDSSTISKQAYPVLEKVTTPKAFGEHRTALEAIIQLQGNWRQPTLAEHLWLLTTALAEGCNAKRVSGAPKIAVYSINLFHYMAGVSYQKILARWNHSQSFYETLRNIRPEDVPLPSQSPRVARLLDGQRTNADQDYDAALANDEMLMEDFISRIDKLSFITVDIPNLSKLAHSLPKPCLIYNDKTAPEIHRLLLNLLQEFEKALRDIAKHENGGQNPSEQLKEALQKAQECAYALLRLARGYAFKLHILNLTQFIPTEPAASNNTDTQSDDPDGRDEDLAALLPGNFAGWIHLVLSQFDAIEIVLSYLISCSTVHPDTVTSIQANILLSPLSSQDMYSWKKLFKNPKYFPIESSKSRHVRTFDVSNDVLLEFLTETVKEAGKTQHWVSVIGNARRICRDQNCDAKKVQEFINDLASLQGLPVVAVGPSTDVDLNDIAKALSHKLQRWYTDDARPDLETTATEKANLLYEHLGSSPLGYAYIAGLVSDTPLFKGAIHCEAALATFLDDITKHSKKSDKLVYPDKEYFNNILSAMEKHPAVIGVSKRCCPVCTQFLFELSDWVCGKPIIVHGGHSSITPCSLPPWTPPEVVDKMIQHFGRLLREDLLMLRKQMIDSNRQGFLRGRSDSTGSTILPTCGPMKNVSQREDA